MTDTKQWHRGMALLKEVRDSLGPMEHKLRSSALQRGDQEQSAGAAMDHRTDADGTPG
jgi:exonuclease VII small subunit